MQKERHGNTPTFLKDGDVDVTGRGRIQNVHGLEAIVVGTERPSSTVDDNGCRRHNDFLTGTWSEETLDGVINVRCPLNDSGGSQEHSHTAQIRVSKWL